MMAVIIRLQNLPLSANASSIRTFFNGLKIPDGGVNIVGGEDGDAFIAFGTDDDARRAMLLTGQNINGTSIRLFLSSKQEMQSIITDAQNRVLKRAVATPSIDKISSIVKQEVTTPIVDNITQKERRSITYYNPDSSFVATNNKVRIIDHSFDVHEDSARNSENNNKENNMFNAPPRPSEFCYKITRHLSPEFRPEYIEYPHDSKPPPPYISENAPHDRYPRYEEHQNIPREYCEPKYRREEHCKSLLPTPPVTEWPPTQRRLPPMPGKPLPIHRRRPRNEESPSFHHDFAERPQWLDDKPVAPLETSTSCLVRVILPFSMMSPKTIFDIFRNISIVPKHGIKIEQDHDKRLTGYVYVHFVNTSEAAKALRMNERVFRGMKILVESMDDADFDKITDRCDQIEDNLDIPLSQRSPYYRDMCLEISNVAADVSENDLKDFLSISINSKMMHFIRIQNVGYCLITANNEAMMSNILSFNGISYRGSIIKVVAISKHQLQAFLLNKGREVRPRPFLEARKYLDASRNCTSFARFVNLKENTKPIDLKNLFLPTVIPVENIFVNEKECLVDFISVATCQKVLEDLKKVHRVDFTMTQIAQHEFLSRKLCYLEAAGGHESVLNAIKSELDSTKQGPSISKCQVTIKNFPTTITNLQVKDLIHNFERQPRAIHICYENGRNLGEAVLAFKCPSDALDFRDEFHGVWFLKRKLEVLLSEK